MKNDNLSKLSLIIPTYNRQSYTLRNMRYWSGRKAILHVLDGSKSGINGSELKDLGHNIHYYHVPISLRKRIEYAISLIDTEYVSLLGDDEFFIPTCLQSCITELEMANGLVSCMGRCLGFRKAQDGIIGLPVYEKLKDYSSLEDEPIARMLGHMKNYIPSTVYSVVKTPVWKNAWAPYLKKEFPVFAIGELQFEMVVSFMGKSKVIPELMWLRSYETAPIRNKGLSLETNLHFDTWWNDPQKSSEHDIFLSIMADTLAGDQDKHVKLISGVENSCNAYVTFCRSRNRKTGLIKDLRSLMKQCLPEPFKQAVKQTLFTLGKRYERRKLPYLVEAAKDLSDAGVFVDFKEIEKIEAILSSFHDVPVSK
jgi:glycosyltransferase domain-containing protein